MIKIVRINSKLNSLLMINAGKWENNYSIMFIIYLKNLIFDHVSQYICAFIIHDTK